MKTVFFISLSLGLAWTNIFYDKDDNYLAFAYNNLTIKVLDKLFDFADDPNSYWHKDNKL